MTLDTLAGRLTLVGTGPGDVDLCTPACLDTLRQADHLVAYGLYIDLMLPAVPELAKKPRHDFALGQETERCRFALDKAAEGCHVALVCSGDAGIYAMSALVFELIDQEANPAWQAVRIDAVAGITAMQTLANKVGAPLGHDFCAISLSDLLTPWETIVRRLEGAAHADFVIGFYNPVSKKRDWQLDVARDLLLKTRPAKTPIAIGRNLGRDGETIRLMKLADLSARKVDMLSVVLVGSSQTRWLKRDGHPDTLYTPRGYAKKNADDWES